MSENRKTVAVVVTYNRRDSLIETIEGILRQREACCDILVVDNGSDYDVCKVLFDAFPNTPLSVISIGFNAGCAGGIYCGIKQGVLAGYDFIWVMDDDVVPDPTALKELLEADEQLGGDWGFLTSHAYWKDGSPCKANIQKKTPFTFVSEREMTGEKTVQVQMASIASLFLCSDVVREVGLPLPEYFFYTEDYEFTSRIAKKAPGYLVPKSRVLHNMKANSKANIAKDTPDRMWRYGYLYRNDVNCYKKLGPAGWAYLVAKTGYTAANVLLHAKGSRAVKLRVLWKSLGDGVRFNPEIEYMDRFECGTSHNGSVADSSKDDCE